MIAFSKDWHVIDFTKPSDTLKRLGLKPEDITDLIISHMHWDHADGMDLFPNARIWIQKDELQYYAGEAWQSKDTHGGIDEEDVLTLIKLNMQGRVGLVNGDAQEIIPGVTCYTGGNIHTNRNTWVCEQVQEPSCWPVTICICMKIWNGMRPSRPPSMPHRICGRRIA